MISAPSAPSDSALLGPPPAARTQNPGATAFPKITPAAEPAARKPAPAEPGETPAPEPADKTAHPHPARNKSGRKPPETTTDQAAQPPQADPANPPSPLLPGPASPTRPNLPTPEAANLPAPQPDLAPQPDRAAGLARASGETAAVTARRGPPRLKTPSPTPGGPAEPASADPAGAGHQPNPANAQPSGPASHQKPGLLAANTPAQPRSGSPGSEGTDSQRPDSQNPDSQSQASRGQGALGQTAAGLSTTAAQSLPFRLEPGAPTAEGPASQTSPAAEPATAAAPLPEAEATVLQQGADVTIGLDSNQRLDVTIATATRQSAERLEAARAELHRDLAALGAEVEAIRVEVRSERAPDGTGQSGQSAAPGGQGERQGQAMRNHSDHPGEQSGQQPSTATGQPAIHISLNPGAGRASASRIDRYA